MLGKLFSAIGNNIGQSFGGSIFASAGRFLGRWLGEQVGGHEKETYHYFSYGRIIDNFYPQSNAIGKVIPLIFGNARVQGQLIWALPLKQEAHENNQIKYFRTHQSIHHKIDFLYKGTFALGICEGVIDSIERIWYNEQVIDISCYKYRLYYGTDDQLIDPAIKTTHGELASAYRGLCYIVFEGLPLADFGNRIPEFSFEINRQANASKEEQAASLISEIVIIPGSGEYVYDTLVQYKSSYHNDLLIQSKAVNCNNSENIANSLYSLGQLKRYCPNVKWVAPVVCWFASSLDADECKIFPAVEFNDNNSRMSESWSVACHTRQTADLVCYDNEGFPIYGGTINDASLLRYLKELKNQGMKVMFYPMIMLNKLGKPWRGHITSTPKGIKKFFNDTKGYKNFILHYANLVKGNVDGFIIGSELKGLTKVREDESFPAVIELIDLAKQVKDILGKNVIITYAADWSEYHHNEEGWYNLDELWACDAIDVIGIDAYFPLTNSHNSIIKDQHIKDGFESGEGYDYYIDSNGNKQDLSKEYAWKNIDWWWSNIHINPNGKQSLWQPKMKKIWFTEFGFPSIDKATNQPNVFYDPKSQDGNIPIHSNGETDFAIQKTAIKLSFEYWRSKPFIDKMFLWTWDARPYPSWPHLSIWRDNNLWEKGHWIIGKFICNSNLGTLIEEISNRCGIRSSYIILSKIEDNFRGIAFTEDVSAWQAIALLKCLYVFDIIDSSNRKIIFTKRKNSKALEINSSNYILSDQNYEHIIEENYHDHMLSKIAIRYFDVNQEYYPNFVSKELDYNYTSIERKLFKIPLILSEQEAINLASYILEGIRKSSKIISFLLPLPYVFIRPSMILKLNLKNEEIIVRVLSTNIIDNIIEVKVAKEISYKPLLLGKQSHNLQLDDNDFHNDEIFALELPYEKLTSIDSKLNESTTVVFVNKGKRQANLQISIDGKNFYKIADYISSGISGKVIESNLHRHANFYFIDNQSSFTIYCTDEITLNDENIFDIQNLFLIGNEYLIPTKIEKINHHNYKISNLMRGLFSTEGFMNSHQKNETFLKVYPNTEVAISKKLQGKQIFYKCRSSIKSFNLKSNSVNDNKPHITEAYICENRFLNLKINIRSNRRDDWDDSFTTDLDLKYKLLLTYFDENSLITSEHTYSYKENYFKKYLHQGISGQIKLVIIVISGGVNSEAAEMNLII